MARTQIDVSDPLRIFSNQMPANPERKHAAMTAASPTAGFPAAWAALPAPAESEGACTITMPAMRTMREPHLTGVMCLPSMVTAKTAVVRILSW